MWPIRKSARQVFSPCEKEFSPQNISGNIKMTDERPLCINDNCSNVAKAYSKTKNRKDGSRTYCKRCSSCQRKRDGIPNIPKPMYKRSKSAKARYNARQKTKKAQFVLEEKGRRLKAQGGCANTDCSCGPCTILPLFVYDFHHIRGEKSFDVSSARTQSYNSIIAEMDKCILLCAVCHRLMHSLPDSVILR